MKEVLDKLTEFNRERDWDQFHTPENLAKSISIEAAELLECFQWDNDYDPDEHVEMWIPYRGKNGMPKSIRTLLNDTAS